MYLLTPEQKQLKEKAWNEMYKDYLKEKEEKDLENELNGKSGAKRKHHKRGSKKQSDNPVDASTQALKNLAPSKKINREILGALFSMDEQALEKGPQSSSELTSALDIHDGEFASSFYADELIGGTSAASSSSSSSAASTALSALSSSKMALNRTNEKGGRRFDDAGDEEDDADEDDDDDDDEEEDDDDDDGGYYGRDGSGGGRNGYDDGDDDNGANDYGDDDENYF